MPRDSTGNYTLPSGSLVSTGDTILVSQHNPPFQDIEQAISGSLDRSGKGGMLAPLPMGGQRITDLAPGVSTTDAATVGQLAGAGSIPVGVVMDYFGPTPPPGWLFAAGQAVSRSTYAALFAAIGTVAGAGDGSTTFNLPDFRGRVSAGRENMATPATTRLDSLPSSTLAGTGGAQSVALSGAQVAPHTHPVTDPTHSHETTRSGAVGTTQIGVSGSSGVFLTTASTNVAATGISVGANTGGEAHPNVQPTIICNKIIKVA